jgi:hypothetical protein
MIGFVASVSSHELNGCKSTASEEPAPKVIEEQANREKGIKADKEGHEFMVIFVDIVIPNTNNRNQIVT